MDSDLLAKIGKKLTKIEKSYDAFHNTDARREGQIQDLHSRVTDLETVGGLQIIIENVNITLSKK